ncbi:hypothetical protein ElyMa_005647200 [Elysia marginata]|uniref:Reverse transcriptase domain-containing protein n=1 Tax=Elysia marginata TaxID=1093978 RepID=A0AAV4FB65_9GAST|nr:hypothetical protein ElyMa_005647200 [Elysia marginata]
MSKFGCPDRFIQMVSQLHDGMQAHVLDDGETSAPFHVFNGVKQGCLLAPISAMLTEVFNADIPGIDISLTLSTKKTEVMYQPDTGKPYTEPTVTVNDVKLAAVYRFTYLGRTLSRNVHIDDETDGRIAKSQCCLRETTIIGVGTQRWSYSPEKDEHAVIVVVVVVVVVVIVVVVVVVAEVVVVVIVVVAEVVVVVATAAVAATTVEPSPPLSYLWADTCSDQSHTLEYLVAGQFSPLASELP